MLAFDCPEIAYAAADVSSDLFGVLICNPKAAIFYSLVARSNGVMNKSAHLARFLLLNVMQWIEVLDFGCKAYRKLVGMLRVELLYVIHAATTLHERRPGGFHRVPDRRNKPDTRDHNATFQDLILL